MRRGRGGLAAEGRPAEDGEEQHQALVLWTSRVQVDSGFVTSIVGLIRQRGRSSEPLTILTCRERLGNGGRRSEADTCSIRQCPRGSERLAEAMTRRHLQPRAESSGTSSAPLPLPPTASRKRRGGCGCMGAIALLDELRGCFGSLERYLLCPDPNAPLRARFAAPRPIELDASRRVSHIRA